MTIAVDAVSEQVRTATTDPFTFSHTGRTTGSGGVQGVCVLVINGTTATDEVNAITYGGVPLTRMVGTSDAAGEPGRAQCWCLEGAAPAGTQTVSVDFTSATGTDQHIVVITWTAAAAIQIIDFDSTSGDLTNPSLTLQRGTRSAFVVAGLYSGLAAPGNATPNGSMTAIHDNDFGNFVSRVDRSTAAGTGDFTASYTAASDDVAMVAVAVAEYVPSGTSVPYVTGSNNGGNSTTPSVVLPAGLMSPGDHILVQVNKLNSAYTTAAPSGFTLVDNFTDGNNATFLFKKQAAVAADGGATVTFDADAGVSKWAVVVGVYRGGDTTDFVTTHDFNNEGGNDATHNSPSIPITNANSTFVATVSDRGAGTTSWTPPTGFTLRQANYQTGGGPVSAGLADDGPWGSTGASGGQQWTGDIGTSADAVGYSVEIAPLSANVNLNRSGAESAPTSEAVTRALVLARTGAESAPAADTETHTLTISVARSGSESAPAADTRTRSLVQARAPPESAPAADTVTRSSTRARAGSESAPAADAGTRAVGRFRTGSESAPAADAYGTTAGKARTAAESAPAADAATRGSSRSRAGAESAPAAATHTDTLVLARAGSESAPAADGYVRVLNRGRTAAESAPASDSVARAQILSRSGAESAPAADTATRAAPKARAAAESAPASDSYAAQPAKARTGAESAPAADTAARATARPRTGAESAPASDAATRAAPKARSGAESAPAADSETHSVVPAGGTGRSGAESAPAADTSSRTLVQARRSSEWRTNTYAAFTTGASYPSIYQVAGTGVNGTITKTTDPAMDEFGRPAVRVDGDGAADYQGIQNFPPTQPASPGQTVTAWVLVKGDAGSIGKLCGLTVHEFTGTTTYVGESGASVFLTGSWQLLQVTRTMGATATGYGSAIRVQSTARTATRFWVIDLNGTLGTTADTYTDTLVQARAGAESAPAADTRTRVQGPQSRSTSESAPASDSLARASARTRTAAESAGGADTTTRQVRLFRSSAGSAPAADTQGHQPQAFTRSRSESAPAADSATYTLTHPTGLVDRPDSGLIPRPDSGTVDVGHNLIPRPYTQTVAPPDSGMIERP